MIKQTVGTFLLLLLCATTGLGQSSGATTGAVVGTVKDSQGAALAQAQINVRQLETNLVRDVESDENGVYRVLQLPPGAYEITAQASGFAQEIARIRLTIGTTALVDIVMAAAGTREVVEIRAGDSAEGRTESSTNIDGLRIINLPINRRSYLDFSFTAPRVAPDRLPAQGLTTTSGISFNGQSARQNNITIDGLDNNDLAIGAVRSVFSQDAVQEFQVVSDNYSAEFGRALGGIVNIVTRGGGNELHGTLFGFVRNDETSARDVFTAREPEYRQYQAGATLGGPIKRDRAFFFASFERLTIKQNNIVTISDGSVAAVRRLGFAVDNGPLPFSVGVTSALARADWRVSDRHTLYLRYNFGGNYNGSLEAFGGLTAASSAGIQRFDDNSFALSDTYVSAALNLVNEARFLYTRRNADVFAAADGPMVQVISDEGQITFGRNTLLPFTRNVNIYQFVDNVTLARERHNIKFGVDLNISTGDARGAFLLGGAARFSSIDFGAILGNPALPAFSALEAFDPSLRTPAQRAFLTTIAMLLPQLQPPFPRGVPLADLGLPIAYLQSFGDPTQQVNMKLFSVYLQDDYQLRPNLLVKAGLRYDISRVRFSPDNNGNISPRLALAYRPARTDRVQIRAAYGIFFAVPIAGPAFNVSLSRSGENRIATLTFPFSVLPFALPGRRFPENAMLPPGIEPIRQLAGEFQYQPDLRASYAHQANLTVAYELPKCGELALSYNLVRGLKLFSLRRINPIVRFVPNNPLLSAITGRVDPTRGDVGEFESAFDSYYHAFSISLSRRFTNRIGVLAHYTFSKAIDNILELRADVLDQPNDTLRPGGERGLSFQDARSRFVLSANWDLDYTRNPLLQGFLISAITTLNTGRPYNLLAEVDPGSSVQGVRPNGVARNAGVTPGFASIDVRLQRKLLLGERFSLQAHVEVFNLFNRVNFSPNEINRTFARNAQGQFNLPSQQDGRFIVPAERLRNALAPRQFQLGLRLSF